ncbi:MAG: hypothetical protein SGI90_08615 [Candidatus Eisenbacteria bacterium]|nr:hypothetical protein [Candidatus Eisenbacteria bacterium]
MADDSPDGNATEEGPNIRVALRTITITIIITIMMVTPFHDSMVAPSVIAVVFVPSIPRLRDGWR